MAGTANDPAPDPLFDAIGRVAVAWSELEAELGHLLVALLHTPMARLLVVGQNYATVHGHIDALMKLHPVLEQHDQPRERLPDELRRRITDELAATKVLADRRNQIIHSQWLQEEDWDADHWISFRPRRGKVDIPGKWFTITEMHGVVRDIEASAQRIDHIGRNVDHRLYGLTEAPGFD